jgi:hypothetical protein
MSNNKQQTAVDRIVNLLNKEGFSPVLTQEEIKSFKEMERLQAINLYYQYEKYAMITESVIMTFGQFYKQTYGGGEQ